jgi:hypothetical protein
MDEPVGRTIDGTPWEEPRGPHLPDPLTHGAARIPLISWLFITLAVIAAVWRLAHSGVDSGQPIMIVIALLGVVTDIAPFLFGAALFARHRQAWSTHRLLVIGIVLLGLAQLVAAIPTLAGGLIVEPDVDMTVVLVLSGLTPAVLTLLGLWALARGLADARTAGAAPLPRAWLVVIWTAAIVMTVGSGYVSFLYFWSTALAEDLGTLAYVVVSYIVGIGIIWTWAYLAAVTLGGRLAGDRPIGAWRFAAIGPLAILAGYAVQLGGYSLIGATLGSVTDLSLLWGISLGAGGATAMGYLALIAAFMSGLPSADDADEPAGDRAA